VRQAMGMEHHQAIFLPGKPELEQGLENVEYMEKDPMIFLVRHSVRSRNDGGCPDGPGPQGLLYGQNLFGRRAE
jgi:hypothetical protein